MNLYIYPDDSRDLDKVHNNFICMWRYYLLEQGTKNSLERIYKKAESTLRQKII